MDEQLKIEIFEKALYIVKNSGKKDGIFYQLNKNGLDIFYADYDEILSIYYNLHLNAKPVLRASSDKVISIDESRSSSWIDEINKEFRRLMKINESGGAMGDIKNKS